MNNKFFMIMSSILWCSPLVGMQRSIADYCQPTTPAAVQFCQTVASKDATATKELYDGFDEETRRELLTTRCGYGHFFSTGAVKRFTGFEVLCIVGNPAVLKHVLAHLPSGEQEEMRRGFNYALRLAFQFGSFPAQWENGLKDDWQCRLAQVFSEAGLTLTPFHYKQAALREFCKTQGYIRAVLEPTEQETLEKIDKNIKESHQPECSDLFLGCYFSGLN